MALCVLDASAILAWIFEERGADTVEKVLAVSAISAVNLAEVLYRCDEEGMDVGELRDELRGLGVEIEPFLAEDAERVMKLRRQGRAKKLGLSLADCCCMATAERLALKVVGGDRAWEDMDLAVEVHPFR